MKILVLAFLLFTLSSPVWAEDTMNPVFERIDDLLTRIESGISLNSYAETLAQLKVDYKKAQSDESRVDNPLLTGRMKGVMQILDDYAYVWRGQENEGKKFILGDFAAHLTSRYPSIKSHGTWLSGAGTVYMITDVKREILNELYTKLDKAKSAHTNGW